MFARIFRCVSIAPLDTPVVPPVYCKNAVSFIDISTPVKSIFTPSFKTSVNDIVPFILNFGTNFLTFLATKLIIFPLKPRRSPTVVTTTLSTLARSDFSTTWATPSQTSSNLASLSLNTCSNSLGVYRGFILMTITPAINAP